MNKKREHEVRRFSLVKFELPTNESNETKGRPSSDSCGLFIDFSSDESKLSVPLTSPNLLQKFLFRQFSPKTRPYPVRLSAVNFDRKMIDLFVVG